MASTGDRFERAVGIMARLRAPGGCPWDREQTFDSIRKYTLEETYEVLEAIDLRDWDELPGELGDLLLQVLFYSQMAKEDGTFSIDDVLDRLCDKLVTRHPHVFGDVTADTPAEVLRNWDAIKAEEKAAKSAKIAPNNDSVNGGTGAPSALAGVSSAMPSLMEAHKLTTKAAQHGFDWPEIGGLFAKLEEETGELQELLAEVPPRGDEPNGPRVLPEDLRERVEDELGDMFFVLVNLARHLSLDSESALRRSNRKFRRRFQEVERLLGDEGKTINDSTLDEMEAKWQQAKRAEKSNELQNPNQSQKQQRNTD